MRKEETFHEGIKRSWKIYVNMTREFVTQLCLENNFLSYKKLRDRYERL